MRTVPTTLIKKRKIKASTTIELPLIVVSTGDQQILASVHLTGRLTNLVFTPIEEEKVILQRSLHFLLHKWKVYAKLM